MRLNGVEALEVQHGLDETIAGGIAIDRRHDVGAEGCADRGLAFERVGIGLPDQFSRYFRTVETVRNAMNDGRFQVVVMQDG